MPRQLRPRGGKETLEERGAEEGSEAGTLLRTCERDIKARGETLATATMQKEAGGAGRH